MIGARNNSFIDSKIRAYLVTILKALVGIRSFFDSKVYRRSILWGNFI